MNQIGLIETLSVCIILLVTISLVFFTFPRVFFPVILGIFIYDLVTNMSFSSVSIISIMLMPVLWISIGIILSCERGKDFFHLLVKRNLGSCESRVVFFASMLSFFVLLSVTLFTFWTPNPLGWASFGMFVVILVIALPRTFFVISLNAFLCFNWQIISQFLGSETRFFIIWAITVILTVCGLAIDLPEAREFLWLIKPRKKKTFRDGICVV